MLVIVLFFIIITCAYLFLKKNKTHTFIFTANSDNNNMRNTLSPPRFPLHLLQKSSLLLLLPSFFCSLSLSSQSRRRRSFSLLACVGCRVAHIFFKSKNPQRATRGNRKRQKRRRREERIHQRRRTGREKKNFEKKKIQLCCSDERERIYSFSTNQISFATERLVVAEQNLSLLGRSHAVCALFLKKKQRERTRESIFPTTQFSRTI